MKTFRCLQVEDYKRKRKGRWSGMVTPGKCVVMYHVELDSFGRPIWIREPKMLHRAWGYDDCEERCILATERRLPELPWIQSANHHKLVTKSEAQKLLGSHWLPAAALDWLTENVVNPEKAEPQPTTEG